MHLLRVQILWRMFMRILMITTQQQKDDMIADIKSDKLL